MSTNLTTGTMGNEDSCCDTPWSHDSAVGKLNTTQSISGSTNRCERKRKQHVATMPQHTKYSRNSSKKINRQLDGLPGCDAGLGVWDICGKRGHEVGLLLEKEPTQPTLHMQS